MRKATISIPSNIAESYKKKKIYSVFKSIADNSKAEMETKIIIAKEIYPKLDFA